jgi:TonB family protein
MAKMLTITLLLFSSTTSLAQTAYLALTPGTSTRTEVESVLGPPTDQVTERLLEYRKDGRQIYVQYSKDSPTAIRMQVIYSPPSMRSEVLAKEQLPQAADVSRANKKGLLEEYFGHARYIVLTYETGSQSQVSQVGYYSRELFESATPELTQNSSPPSQPATANQKTNSPPISGGALNGSAVSLPQPVYPPGAGAKVSGTVTVRVTVDESGQVVSATAVSGHLLLRGAAEAAARLAKFNPRFLSGQPVKVIGTLTYEFSPQ